MPRAPLTIAVALMLLAAAVHAPASARNPHLDSASVPDGCPACHQGHGATRSPMLPGSQKQLCFACHGSMADAGRSIAVGSLSANAQPTLIAAVSAKLYAHPISPDATSAEPDVVTCTSCHSPHRGLSDEPVDRREAKRSPRDPAEPEFELCESCHGRESGRRSGVARKFDPNNRSFHPVEAPTSEHADSVGVDQSGSRIACTDCHGNDDRHGPRGPHGSSVPFILKESYRESEGAESAQAFALCYGCHDRENVLRSEPHTLHVRTRGASCRTCHDAHGSVSHRALVHIGDGETIQQVLPSLSKGKLEFVSERRGAAECYLTCHGVDHGPKSYGTQSTLMNAPPIGGPQIPIATPWRGTTPFPIERPVVDRGPMRPREQP